MVCAVLSHDETVQGEFFSTLNEAMNYFRSRPFNMTHAVLNEDGNIIKHWGRRGNRGQEMGDWWTQTVGGINKNPTSTPSMQMLNDSQRLHECLPDDIQGVSGAVLVLPGGGYAQVEIGYEGREIAEWLRERNFAGFALDYTLEPRRRMEFGRAMGVEPALEEAVTAYTLMSKRLAELGLGGTKTFIMGFSAGAHLTMCTLRRLAELKTDDSTWQHPTPHGAILVYPPAVNPLCIPCILGTVGWINPLTRTPRMISRWLDSDNCQHKWCDVHAAARVLPSTLLVASTQDKLLPCVSNADVIVQAMRNCETPVTYIRREFGNHGFALRGWESDLEDWLRSSTPLGLIS